MFLFDMDGTLIESNRIWKDVDREFLARRGLPYTHAYYEGVSHTIMTRAKERLTLTNARQRMLYGRTSANRPSRFLEELPEENYEWSGRPAAQVSPSEGSGGSWDGFGSPAGISSGFPGGRPGSFGSGFSGGQLGGFGGNLSGGLSGNHSSSSVRTYQGSGAAPRSPVKRPTAVKPASEPLMQVAQGDAVEHTAFGKGTVLSVKSMDYQLSQPVSETLQGVDYVNDWLRRLCLEQDFLRRFDPSSARAVVARSCPDYRRLLINLFEPVAVNALGLALQGEDPRILSVSPSLRRKLETQFAPLTEAESNAALSAGAESLCAGLGIQNQQATRYLNGLALGLRPRLRAALDAGTLEYVFLEFPVSSEIR